MADQHSTVTATAEAGATPTGQVPGTEGGLTEAALVEDEMLVEEVSIDGMCGVY